MFLPTRPLHGARKLHRFRMHADIRGTWELRAAASVGPEDRRCLSPRRFYERSRSDQTSILIASQRQQNNQCFTQSHPGERIPRRPGGRFRESLAHCAKTAQRPLQSRLESTAGLISGKYHGRRTGKSGTVSPMLTRSGTLTRVGTQLHSNFKSCRHGGRYGIEEA